MLSRIVVGTLSTLNTVMTPFAGSPERTTFKLELPASQQPCPGHKAQPLDLKLTPGINLNLSVRGQVCAADRRLKAISINVDLPEDLNDEQFLANIPVNASYLVTTGVSPNRRRIKITRRPDADGLTPVLIEWLPQDLVNGTPERGPITIYLDRHSPRTANSFPWRRIELSELDTMLGPEIAMLRAPNHL